MTSRRPATRRNGERGFALLMVFLMAAVVAISLYLEMPRVAFESQRNREELLVQRGEQYKRAVELYYRKTKMYPQKLEDLENTNNFRFLRKRYKDPLTGKDEWRLVHMGPAGLTDSLVEKMPGLDGDKKKDGKEVAAAKGPDGQEVKTADDAVAGSERTARDQRALMAQGKGGGPGVMSQGAGGGQEEDPNAAFQRQQLEEYWKQQAALGQQQQQQQVIGGAPNPNQGQPWNQQAGVQQFPGNPGGPPQGNMVAAGAQPINGQDPNNPFAAPSQQQQQNPFAQQQNPFPPIGSPNGPVRTLYPQQQVPFSPGNAMMRGAIPNPGASVANSAGFGGAAQPFGGGNPNNFGQQPPSGFGQQGFGQPGFGQPGFGQPSGGPPRLTGPSGAPGGGTSSFGGVPPGVRDSLFRPQGAGNAGAAAGQSFGGAGIAGIASNAPGSGIKRYAERSKYKEWEFVYDYRKPGKGQKKGTTGVGGLNTSNGTNNNPNSSPFGNNQGGSGGFGNNTGGFGNNNQGNSGFGGPPRRP